MSEPFPDTSVEIEERITSYFNCARRSREDYFAVAEELGGLTLERPLVTQPFGSKRPVPIMALQPAELMRGIGDRCTEKVLRTAGLGVCDYGGADWSLPYYSYQTRLPATLPVLREGVVTKRAVAVPVSVPIETVAKMMGLSEEGQAWIVKWWPVLARMAEYRPRSFARFCAILELINKYDLTEEEILSIV